MQVTDDRHVAVHSVGCMCTEGEHSSPDNSRPQRAIAQVSVKTAMARPRGVLRGTPSRGLCRLKIKEKWN